jgi:hypothetical protein
VSSPPVVTAPASDAWALHFEDLAMANFCASIADRGGFDPWDVIAIASSYPAFMDPLSPATSTELAELARAIAASLGGVDDASFRHFSITVH